MKNILYLLVSLFLLLYSIFIMTNNLLKTTEVTVINQNLFYKDIVIPITNITKQLLSHSQQEVIKIKDIIIYDTATNPFYGEPLLIEVEMLDKEMLKQYITREISIKNNEYIDTFINKAILRVEDSKINLKDTLYLKSKIFSRKIIKDSIIHYILTKGKSKLFADKGSTFDNIMIRANLLAAIAESETGYFNYNSLIFSPTQAFGTFQINGNTLGYEFELILRVLNQNALDFQNKNFEPKKIFPQIIHNKEYQSLSKLFYKNNSKHKDIRRKLSKIEEKVILNISHTLFTHMNTKDLLDKNLNKYIEKLYNLNKIKNKTNKIEKQITYYKKKINNIFKKQISNISTLLKRTMYGLEHRLPNELKNKYTGLDRRLKVIEISANLIESSIYTQGVFALIVAESKYNYLVSKKSIKSWQKLSINTKVTSTKNYQKIIKSVTKFYNGGEDKEAYARRALNHANKSLYKIREISKELTLLKQKKISKV